MCKNIKSNKEFVNLVIYIKIKYSSNPKPLRNIYRYFVILFFFSNYLSELP